jgi:hypothetical protein
LVFFLIAQESINIKQLKAITWFSEELTALEFCRILLKTLKPLGFARPGVEAAG